jgi:hypothetical protein
MGQTSPANPAVGAAIMPGEAADVVVAPSPPVLSLAPASTPAGDVAADVGMVEVPPPVVIPDLPVLSREEGATVVAEASDRRPATFAEERPSALMAVVSDASAAAGPDALVDGRA